MAAPAPRPAAPPASSARIVAGSSARRRSATPAGVRQLRLDAAEARHGQAQGGVPGGLGVVALVAALALRVFDHHSDRLPGASLALPHVLLGGERVELLADDRHQALNEGAHGRGFFHAGAQGGWAAGGVDLRSIVGAAGDACGCTGIFRR